MTYSKKLRELFPDITLQSEDLLLLETFQIHYLPGRIRKKEFAALLRKHSLVHRFLVNKHPDLFDSLDRIHWDIEEIKVIASPEGKIVADIGAGAGRIAFLVAPYAQTVFAVEPIASLRLYMRDKAVNQGIKNLYVMDGTLDLIPLPNNSLDVLITSNAIGWSLNDELKEIERVVRQGGHVIHLLHSEPKQENPHHEVLTSATWSYEDIQKPSESSLKLIYHKTVDNAST